MNQAMPREELVARTGQAAHLIVVESVDLVQAVPPLNRLPLANRLTQYLLEVVDEGVAVTGRDLQAPPNIHAWYLPVERLRNSRDSDDLPTLATGPARQRVDPGAMREQAALDQGRGPGLGADGLVMHALLSTPSQRGLIGQPSHETDPAPLPHDHPYWRREHAAGPTPRGEGWPRKKKP